jgi:hypothetical protein
MHAASRAIARAFDLGGERLDGAALLEQVGDTRRVADGHDLHSLRVVLLRAAACTCSAMTADTRSGYESRFSRLPVRVKVLPRLPTPSSSPEMFGCWLGIFGCVRRLVSDVRTLAASRHTRNGIKSAIP